MPENTPALSPEQIPTELVPHYAEPGTVYDDEPGELVPPGWYVLGEHGHGEGADIEIKIEHAVDANGNDISGPLAAKIAELLEELATEEDPEEFCDRCFAGVDSPEHHEKCVTTGHALDGEPALAVEQSSEWSPTVGERVTGRLDGTGTETTGRYVGPGAQPWLSILDVGRTARPQVVTSTLRPADTGKETDR